MARTPKLLTRLRIDEISSVDRGAGEGVHVVLMKRHDRNRFTDVFRRVDFSKVKTNPPPVDDEIDGGTDQDDLDTDTKLSPQLEQHVAAMIVAVPTLTRQQAVHWLLNTASGRALAEHLNSISKSRKETPMSKTMDRNTELQSIVKSHGGVQAMAKLFVADGKTHGVTEHELTGLAFEEAKKHALPGERHNSAFARWYSEPDQLTLRKAIQIAKNTPAPRLMDIKPEPLETPLPDDAENTDEAYAELMGVAEALRRKNPGLSSAKAFAQAFEQNPELANRVHRRPRSGEWDRMPLPPVS